jgi:hypothetical protein
MYGVASLIHGPLPSAGAFLTSRAYPISGSARRRIFVHDGRRYNLQVATFWVLLRKESVRVRERSRSGRRPRAVADRDAHTKRLRKRTSRYRRLHTARTLIIVPHPCTARIRVFVRSHYSLYRGRGPPRRRRPPCRASRGRAASTAAREAAPSEPRLPSRRGRPTSGPADDRQEESAACRRRAVGTAGGHARRVPRRALRAARGEGSPGRGSRSHVQRRAPSGERAVSDGLSG